MVEDLRRYSVLTLLPFDIDQFVEYSTIVEHTRLINPSSVIERHANYSWLSLHLTQAPLSFGQEQILFDEHIRFPSNTNAMYSIPLVFRIPSGSSVLSITRLRRALQALIIKHTVLRTAFSVDSTGIIVQSVVKIIDFNDNQSLYGLTVFNINDHDVTNSIGTQIQRSNMFDLTNGRLVHCYIIRHLSSNEDLLTDGDMLVFSVHHLVFDNVSASIFFRELGIAYDTDGILSINDNNSLQYIDYAVYERIMNMTTSHDFWYSQLKGYDLEHHLPLPIDRNRIIGDRRSGAPIRVEFSLDNDLSYAFIHYASAHQVTPFQLGLAIFYAFLFKLSNGESDLCITCINNNRYRTELRNMIGMFITTLPYRIQLDPQQSFDQLLERVRHECLSILEHIHYPLQHIITDSNHQHLNLAFLEIMFNFITLTVNTNRLTLDGVHLESASLSRLKNETKFDLMCTFTYNQLPSNNRISCSLTCSRYIFDPDTVQILADRYSFFVRQLFDPAIEITTSVPLYTLSIILPDEQILMHLMNIIDDSQYETMNSTIGQIFSQQSSNNPQKVAAELVDQSFTYSELLYYAQAIAMDLIEKHNIVPGDIVCLSMERSLSMVIGIMSIKMAGCVYCSITSRDPDQRLHKLIKHPQSCKVLVHWLTQGNFKEDDATLDIDRMINTNNITNDNELYRLLNVNSTLKSIAFVPTIMKNEETQNLSIENNNLESNLFQNTTIQSHIPNIQLRKPSVFSIPDTFTRSISLFPEKSNKRRLSQWKLLPIRNKSIPVPISRVSKTEGLLLKRRKSKYSFARFTSMQKEQIQRSSIQNNTFESNLFQNINNKSRISNIQVRNHSVFSRPHAFTIMSLYPEQSDNIQPSQWNLLPIRSRSISDPVSHVSKLSELLLRRRKSKYSFEEPILIQNKEIQRLSIENNSLEPNIFQKITTELHKPTIQVRKSSVFSRPNAFTSISLYPESSANQRSSQWNALPIRNRSISDSSSRISKSNELLSRRRKSKYSFQEPSLMQNTDIQRLSRVSNSLEPDLFQKHTTELHIPIFQNDLIILLDEHDRVVFTSRYTCSEIIYSIRNWEKLRDFFVDNISIDSICNDVSWYITDIVRQLKPNYVANFMLKLCMYREYYINDLLQQLMKLFPNQLLIENESGSRDPESDYDITLASSDGSDADIDACAMFNKFFSTHWSLPAGIVFDTNLYPRHLNTIEPKFNVNGTGLGIFLHIPCDYPHYFFTEVNDYKQNKMSLIKLRRYMTGKEWQHYTTIITQNEDNPLLKEIFRNAEITYWKYMKRLLTHISEPNESITSALNEIENIISTMKTSLSSYDLTKFEILWNKIDQELKHVVMEHGNMLHLSYLRQARDIERKIRQRKDRYEDSVLSPIIRIPPSEMLYIDALIVSMRHKFAKAAYFANDTNVAEGSLFYTAIEQYNNHADRLFVKDKALRTNLITNNQLYQSINEQYSGFLKDIKHYSEKQVHNGRIIYRSSKYLYRLLSTIVDSGRHKWNRMGFNNNNETKILKVMVEELLLPIRKCKYPFDGLKASYRAQMSEQFTLSIFPTDSQLEEFWKYRRSTLDESSEFFKYKYNTWDIMKAPHYRQKIKDLLIADLKILAIEMRENINNTHITLDHTIIKHSSTTDVFPNIDESNDANNKSFVINIEDTNQFDAASCIIHQNSSIIEQLTSTVHNLVVDSNEKIYQKYFRGMMDDVPDIIRYIFNWNINRFNIVIKYTRQEEYRRVKQSKVQDYITLHNYLTGIILGLILVCIQLFILAPITFIIKPIKKSIWILKSICKIRQPSDRVILNIRAAYITLKIGNISVVHDSKIIDTGITICDAYGTNVLTSYVIGIMRLFSIIMVEGIVWFSWMLVIITIIGVIGITVILKYSYLIRDLYIVCSLFVCIIDIVLNTWTTIRRHLLLYNPGNVQYLATIRENQRTRASYLSTLSFIILGILLNIISTTLDSKRNDQEWINIIPFVKILDTQPARFSSVQLIVLIITQGIANTLIGVINEVAAGEGRIPDYELSCRNRIDRKEWLNFPVGTICSILKLKARQRN